MSVSAPTGGKVLVLTNDFPTRRGGIETFVLSLCHQLPPDQVVVYTARMPGGAEYDATLPFEVHRDPTPILLPTPAVARRVARVFRQSGCDRVLVGSSVPMGLLAAHLRRAGATSIVAMTHGHEVWWSRFPATRQALHRVGASVDTMTYVSRWCRDHLASALPPGARERMRPLSPGVDPHRFHPDCGGLDVRRRLGWDEATPVVVCTARLVPRKGQDLLVRAWPRVLTAVPDARLLLVGKGHGERRIRRLARPLGDAIVFAGSVPWAEVPAFTDAGDVFAMPCRTRLAGLEPEAFGIVFLEAAACGLPVVAGDSGGAPETLVDGETGYVVPGRDSERLADVLVALLRDPARAREMGGRGRERVVAEHTWADSGRELRRLLWPTEG